MGDKPAQLVDDLDGKLDRRIFTDEELFVAEVGRVFSRAWLLVGHDSLLPKVHDFFSSSMGLDPVLLTRDGAGTVHVLLNRCVHGTNRVTRAEQGHADVFTCAHGWRFGTDGRLVAEPEGTDPASLPGLVAAPKVAHYAGFIFASWDPRAPSLGRYLGDIRWYLDTLVDRLDGGVELLGPLKWSGPFNWKIPADNFVGGQFYASIVNPDIEGAALLPALADEDPYSRRGYEASVGNGHGIGMRLAESEQEVEELRGLYRPRGLAEYERTIRPDVERRLGAVRAHQLFPHNATVFPNASFLWDTPSLHIWHPRGPEETEVWTFAIVDRTAPSAVRDIVRRGVVQLAGPAGILEQDAVDNWAFATRSGNSVVGRRYPADISMGLGREQQHAILPGTVVPSFYSEVAQRGLYRFWQAMLGARSWRGVSLAPATVDRRRRKGGGRAR